MMKKVPLLLTFLSLTAVLIIIERLSPTTHVILQPYSFLRVHEVFQMTIVITLSVVVTFYLLKTLSNNFTLLKSSYGMIAGIIFLLGTYFMATGNGLHEVASYLFNTFCNTKLLYGGIYHGESSCGSMFFNDYYFGNIVYFVGLFLGNLSLIMLERINPQKMKQRDIVIVIVNGFVLALTFIAYAAPDPVLIGLGYVIFSAVVIDTLLFTAKKKLSTQPFTLYSAIGYTVAAVVTLSLRFH